MNTAIQEWFNTWLDEHKKTDLIYAKSAEDQVCFVRDNVRYATRLKECTVSVVSTHTSKSVRLPVYRVVLSPKLHVTLRGNFYNWKLSVVSEKPLKFTIGNGDLWDWDTEHHEVYFEGFSESDIHGSYNVNPSQFSLELGYNEEVWMFFRLLATAAKDL